MPDALPNLDESQIQNLIQEVAAYIECQRETYRDKATPLDENQKATFAPFFPQSVLDSARILVLHDERVGNPPFYATLVDIGFDPALLPDFTEMGAITFVDTIVSHVPIDNRLLFHELVHVVQYDKLGVAEFAGKYVKGFLTGGSYEAIPLERNAYELDARFAAAPATAFSVENEIQGWIDFQLF